MLMFPKSFMAILLMGSALAPQDAPKPKPANGIVFLKIPAGGFVMGSADGGDNEKPAHRVVIPSILSVFNFSGEPKRHEQS